MSIPSPVRSEAPARAGYGSKLPPQPGGEAKPAGVMDIRLLLVRHAQSANKQRAAGQVASKDPGLSELGFLQAEKLGDKLAKDLLPRRGPFRSDEAGGCGIVIVSSPMRRCLLTILPAARQLRLVKGSCFVHGACFEFGCAGLSYAGSKPEDISDEFPDFEPIGFSTAGTWDYRGNSEKETEPECRARAARIASWLRGQGAALLWSQTPARVAMPTLILVLHQSLADALCHCLLHGDAERWAYAEVKYKLSNASITELFLHPDGEATLGHRNDNVHLMGM